ncbi:TPA: hypothetical protein MYV30_000550 [Klebsiella pneumoniae]|uniref:hypothetical protein n=1 Tax=Klebsiella pneumoniae TaxID=573 RepID=UPI00285D5059|nr:hypothetical protein [Klebsiella pneumoniae]HCB2891686.1 hypothetical protein [Klebsiella pneumoniae]HCB3613008.1 hypothetical protein [Klebsiella pneumoniae]HCM5522926.1 hypothetical protein [Klebsiella pneumoniae]HCM6033634.1 hypothetical protein [Klebsiella pneumoniae]
MMKPKNKLFIISAVIFCSGLFVYSAVAALKHFTRDESIVLSGKEANNFFSNYIIPITGPGIHITNQYAGYDVTYGIDNDDRIELHVSVLRLRTYKENADLGESNKNYVEGSKTVFSFGTDVYTEDFIKFTSEATKRSTKEGLKKLYCNPDGFYPMSSQERIFYEARKEHKKIIIDYYSDSGKTLMFGIGISPESCSQK